MPFGEEIYAGVGARGESLKYSLSGLDNIRKRFTGYEKDAETDLDFAEARMYRNQHGRFTTIDPLMASADPVNPQTFNRYAYTGNNPTNVTDPSGLGWCRNNQTGEAKWTGQGVVCEEGFSSFDDQEKRVSLGGDFNGTYLPTGTIAFFNADGSVSIREKPADANAVRDQEENVIRAEDDAISSTSAEIGSTISTPSVGDHAASAFMTIMENEGIAGLVSLISGSPPYRDHTQLGQNIGDTATLVQATIQIVGGLTATTEGGILTIVTSPACATGAGCALPAGTATVTAGGLVTAAHGTALAVNTIYNMASNQGPSSRSGNSNNTPQGPSNTVADSTTGKSVPNTDTSASPLSAARTLKQNGYKVSRSADRKALIFTKGNTKYSLRMNSKSRGGPTLHRQEGKEVMRKIRLNN